MPAQPRPFLEYLAEAMALDDAGCWVWIKDRTKGGYGLLPAAKNRRRRTAHVWVWLHLRDEIPEGLQLDHLCRVRSCVNPDHLEAVTASENVRRAFAATRDPERCINGHPWADVASIDGRGNRFCRECARIKSLRHRGLPIRERRNACSKCGRSMAAQNVSRHEAKCEPGRIFSRGRGPGVRREVTQ